MRLLVRCLLIVILVLTSTGRLFAEPFGQPAFREVWQRTDYPVQQGIAQHSWVWGPEPFTPLLNEAFAEGPGGRRAGAVGPLCAGW